MPTIDQYTVSDAVIRLLLQGPPGSGKTTLACHFPRPWIFDLDRNLAGPLRWLRQHNGPMPVGYDHVDITDSGTPIPEADRFDVLDRKMIEVQKRTDVDTLVIDGGTRLSSILMAYTKKMQPSIKDGRQLFGFFYQYGAAFLDVLTRMRKHIIFVVHEKPIVNEGGALLGYEVHWPGQLKDVMGGFFTDHWRAETKEIPQGLSPSKYEFNLRTMPNSMFKLKNGLDLPPIFTFDWKLIEQKLKETVSPNLVKA